MISAVVRAVLLIALVRWPRLLLAIGANLAIIAHSASMRSFGVPSFGPGTGE